MRRGWSIENHRVELEVNATVCAVRVDGATPPALAIRSNLLGVWPIPVGDQVVTLRRVRVIDVARNELWAKGERIPPSSEPLRRTKSNGITRCKVHRSRERPMAAVECGVCHLPACSDCMAVDGVRCADCFAEAVRQMKEQDRANRIKGPLIAIALIGAIAIFGVVAHVRQAVACAGGLTGLFVVLLVWGLIRERMERAPPQPLGR